MFVSLFTSAEPETCNKTNKALQQHENNRQIITSKNNVKRKKKKRRQQQLSTSTEAEKATKQHFVLKESLAWQIKSEAMKPTTK